MCRCVYIIPYPRHNQEIFLRKDPITIGGFEIFGLEILRVKKMMKWVVLPSKSSLATIKQVSKSFTKNLKIDRKFP